MKNIPQSNTSSDDEWVEAPPVEAIQVKRDDWMNESFDSIGKAKRRRNPDELADDELTPKELAERKKKAARIDRELNPDFKKVLETDHSDLAMDKFTGVAQTQPTRKYEFGDKGSSWRMMKLKRVFESAERECLPVEELALERYGSLEEFEDAIAERDFLEGKSSQHKSVNRKRSSKYMDPRGNAENVQRETTRYISIPVAVTSQQEVTVNDDIMSVDQLNKLYSKLLKAKMMGSPDVEELEKSYEIEKSKSENSVKVVYS